MEQREGRILRQGNKNSTVQVFRYVTEGSFDAYMWQTLETKAKFIAQVMSGDMTIRRLEDLDSAALTYAEVKAIASGNPLVIEKAQVDAELMRLTRLRSAHAEEQYRIRSNLRRSHEDAEVFSARLTNLRQDIAIRQDTAGDKFSIELDDQETSMKAPLLEIEAIVSNAIAQLSVPKPSAEKAKRGLEIAWKKLQELVEEESGRDPLLEAKRKLVLIYLRMAEKQFTDADAEIFSILSKEQALQDELERARKNCQRRNESGGKAPV